MNFHLVYQGMFCHGKLFYTTWKLHLSHISYLSLINDGHTFGYTYSNFHLVLIFIGNLCRRIHFNDNFLQHMWTISLQGYIIRIFNSISKKSNRSLPYQMHFHNLYNKLRALFIQCSLRTHRRLTVPCVNTFERNRKLQLFLTRIKIIVLECVIEFFTHDTSD